MASDAELVQQQSLLSWIGSSLGLPYAALLLISGLLCFVLSLILVLRGRGPMAAASLILIVHEPLLIGSFAAVQGGLASYRIIATSSAAPKPSEVAAGISTALVAPLVGLLLMVPAYATAALGGFIRALLKKADAGKPSSS